MADGIRVSNGPWSFAGEIGNGGCYPIRTFLLSKEGTGAMLDLEILDLSDRQVMS